MKDGLKALGLLVLAILAGWYSLARIDPTTGQLNPHGELVAQGLDLKGGMRVTMEPDPTKPDGQHVSAEKMEKVRDVLENRVNSFGLSGTEVRLKGNNQVLVVLPGVKNPEEALKTISTVAQLEFRYLNDVHNEKNLNGRYTMSVQRGDATKGESDTYTFTDAQTHKPVPQEQVIGEAQLILKGNALKPTSSAQIDPQKAAPIVTFELNGEGAKAFGDFTTDHVGEILAVVLDNKIISAPTINEPITEGHGEISGSKTMAEGRVLANLLNSGALPVPLRTAETQFVGATLGKESIERSIHAGLVGLALVLVFMIAYYWLPGFLACIALLFYAALTFSIYKGVMLFRPIPLDLPGITGFILSVGMAVDANILIFERLKEELRAGKTLHSAIDAGFNRAFTAILDSNVTTWIVCAVLIWLGAPIIKGFAITLAIGVAVSMFTAITVTRTLLHLAVQAGLATSESAYGLNVGWLRLVFPQVNQGGVLRVFEKRNFYFGFTLVLAALGLVFIALTPTGHGLKPGIDFTGGSEIEVAFRNPGVDRGQIEKVLADAGVRDAQVRVARSERPWTRVDVTTSSDLDDVTLKQIERRLSQTVGLETFDPGAYQVDKASKPRKITATYVGEVTQGQIRTALTARQLGDDTDLGLKELNVSAAKIDHGGDKAIQIADITTALTPDKLRNLSSGAGGSGSSSAAPLFPSGAVFAENAPAKMKRPNPPGPAAAANAPAAGTTAAANAPGAAASTAAAPAAGPVAAKTPPANAPAASTPAASTPASGNAPAAAANAPPANAPVANAPAANAPAGNTAPISAAGAPTPASQSSALRERLNAIPGSGGIIEPMYQESSIGPTVAQEVTGNAFFSVVVASIAIILYLAFRFAIGGLVNGLKFGTCAVIALIHDVVITIGFFALMGGLAGWRVDSLFVTACLTVMGFSVHDTIVVYDRIRENLLHRRKGETFADVSDRSITQTFDRSINTSFTVLLVVAALVIFGGETVRLFNVALLFGIAIGTYSSVFVASPLVVLLERSIASREAAHATVRPAARPAPGAARRDDVALRPSRGRDTPSVSPRPANGGARPAPAADGGAGAAADAARDEADATRSGTVRPRSSGKKRRM